MFELQLEPEDYEELAADYRKLFAADMHKDKSDLGSDKLEPKAGIETISFLRS